MEGRRDLEVVEGVGSGVGMGVGVGVQVSEEDARSKAINAKLINNRQT